MSALRLASFGETNAAARLAMLYLQAFDYSGANANPYGRLDYARLIGWLQAVLELDPRRYRKRLAQEYRRSGITRPVPIKVTVLEGTD